MASFKFFPCEIEGDAAFVYVDVDAHAKVSQLPGSLARVKLHYQAPRPNGLPTGQEFEAARAIEVALENFARRGRDRYVGRITRSGFREFHVYTRRSKTDWQTFLERLTKKSGYSLTLRLTSDKSHRVYLRELYPTADAWQVISDIDVLTLLQKEGDRENVRRRIDHWSYFDNEKAAAKFIRWALKNGFKHDAKASGAEDHADSEYCARLYHVGTTRQREISWHAITLNRAAEDHGGRYDGWETKVVKRR
jgi:Regulator of ribonuclease activity B/Family of unknown function (DUF695)